MRTLRLILCWIYGFAAFIFLRTSVSTYREILFLSQFRGPWSNVRGIAGALIVVAVGVVYGMAWWTILLRKPSARIWAMIASILQILLCVLFCGLDLYRGPGIMWQPVLLLIAIGVAGLVAFWRRDAITQPAKIEKVLLPPSLPGDGTSALVNRFFWVPATALFIAGYLWWQQWGNANHLQSVSIVSFWVNLIAAELLVVFLHELGHAITGVVLGMKLHAFIVGPLQWHVRDGKWSFEFVPARFISMGGATSVVPSNPNQPRWRWVCMVAGGPFANLVIGLIAWRFALEAPGRRWENAWPLFALIATLSLLAFVINLIPVRGKILYSDGAFIYQLFSPGPWADYHQAIAISGSTLVTLLRPKDYDIAAIERAAGLITQGFQALQLRMMASSYHLDCGQIFEATQSFAEAEAIFHTSASNIPAESYPWFIFRKAFLQRDALGARQWWDNMEAKKIIRPTASYWLAKSALLWIENRFDESREAWEKSNALAQTLPKAGDYEFDRYRLTLLRKALDEPSTAETPEPLRLSSNTFPSFSPDALPAS